MGVAAAAVAATNPLPKHQGRKKSGKPVIKQGGGSKQGGTSSKQGGSG
jgi:hypothetical protein